MIMFGFTQVPPWAVVVLVALCVIGAGAVAYWAVLGAGGLWRLLAAGREPAWVRDGDDDCPACQAGEHCGGAEDMCACACAPGLGLVRQLGPGELLALPEERSWEDMTGEHAAAGDRPWEPEPLTGELGRQFLAERYEASHPVLAPWVEEALGHLTTDAAVDSIIIRVMSQ